MKHCLACAQPRVEDIFTLGKTALANKFLTREDITGAEPKFPLSLGFCHGCGHVQLTEIVPPAAMFEDYLYVSAASDTLKDHLFELSDIVADRCSLAPKDLVVDVGCNDGTLLRGFRRHHVRTLGVDPARNLAALNPQSGVERCVAFFGAKTATAIAKERGQASVITITNTFPHIQNLPDFLEGVRVLMATGGRLVIEAHYLRDMLEQDAFDTIYHEHVSYWSLRPMMRLFESAGMEVISAERVPIHHGQLRVFVQRKGESTVDTSVTRIASDEENAGLNRVETYYAFANRALVIKENILQTLRSLRRDGKRIAGYGAPAKGNTLLGFLEIGPDLVEYIVDRSPLKQGRFTPGTHIPVVPTQRLIEDQPDYVILFAWNFVDEILEQQRTFRQRGGKFIVPIPTLRIVQ